MTLYSVVKRKLLWIAIYLFCLPLISACGVIWDAGVQVSSISLPPGDLFRAEFYQTATPEDVKKAINNRSLEGKSYQSKDFQRDSGGFLFSKSDMQLMGIFIPTSHVNEGELVYPLTLAMHYSPYPEVITQLVNAGADAQGFDGWAWSSFKPESVKALLTHRDLPYLRCVAFVQYADLGNLDLVKFIIGLDPNIINCSVSNADTALISAVKKNNIDVVTYLITQGADLEQRDLWHHTALSYAVSWNKVQVAKLLLQQGADGSGLYPITFMGEKQFSLLNLAQKNKVTDNSLLALLTEQSPVEGEAGEHALTALCLLNKPALMKRLQARGARFPIGETCATIIKKSKSAT